MAENIIKTIQINPAGGDVQTRPIGAEAENVIISRGLDGKVIENNAAISEVASTEGTAKWVNKSESNLIGDVTIENTDVAKASHNEGTYFLWKGDLTRAKENIARNGAISSSNAEKVSLAEEIVSMKETFQDGVNAVYEACVSAGLLPDSLTPSDKTPEKITQAILDNLDGTTAAASDILKTKTAYSEANGKVTGTIENRGSATRSINAGSTSTIEPGYYTGGTITAKRYHNGSVYSYPSGSTGDTVTFAVDHNYTGVNASNVYTKGMSVEFPTSLHLFKTGDNVVAAFFNTSTGQAIEEVANVASSSGEWHQLYISSSGTIRATS